MSTVNFLTRIQKCSTTVIDIIFIDKSCVSLVYDDKRNEVETTKFPDLQIDSNLNWRAHIQYIMLKLSSTCFAMRTVKSLMKTESLKLAHCAYFHSVT
jgi:hypothetical protein